MTCCARRRKRLIDPLGAPAFKRARAAKPNGAHVMLAKLCIASLRRQIAPNATFTLITQNVDGLSTRALESVKHSLEIPATTDDPTEQDPQILEMHGRLFDVLCTSGSCAHIEHNQTSPICPALAGTEGLVEAGVLEPTIHETDLPRCTKCGRLARPGVVWFGEKPKHLETIDGLVRRADLCLVVGTSSTVRSE